MFNTANFNPVGSRKPIARPREYEDKDINPKFMNAFNEFAKYPSKTVDRPSPDDVIEYIENVEFNIDDVNVLLWSLDDSYKEYPFTHAVGIFVSACYNELPDKVIVYTVDFPAAYMGHSLPEDKVLINKSDVGFGFGYNSKGLLVNFGSVGNGFGNTSYGTVINYRVADGRHCAAGKHGGIVVNDGHCRRLGEECDDVLLLSLKNPIKYGYVENAKLILDENRCRKVPELTDYISDLERDLENGKYYSSKEVENNIKKILEGYGYEL